MSAVKWWARLRARVSYPLRRGAWYRVLGLTPLDAILEVNQQPVRVPRPFLQILPIRPRMWSVVSRPRDAVDPPPSWGTAYGVCPGCSARAPLDRRSARMRCPECDGVFEVAWSDAYWGVLEVAWAQPWLASVMPGPAA